jgi:hypothetical protein
MPSVNVTAPIVVSLSAEGTATLELNQTGGYSFVNPADMTFDCSASLLALKNAFVVDEPTSDNSADFDARKTTVEAAVTAFKNSLKDALNAGTSRTVGYANANNYNLAPVGSVPKVYLLNQAQKDLDADLAAADGIAASLSAEQMKDVAISSAAWTTTVNNAVADCWNKLIPAACEQIARQLPNARYAEAPISQALLTALFLKNSTAALNPTDEALTAAQEAVDAALLDISANAAAAAAFAEKDSKKAALDTANAALAAADLNIATTRSEVFSWFMSNVRMFQGTSINPFNYTGLTDAQTTVGTTPLGEALTAANGGSDSELITNLTIAISLCGGDNTKTMADAIAIFNANMNPLLSAYTDAQNTYQLRVSDVNTAQGAYGMAVNDANAFAVVAAYNATVAAKADLDSKRAAAVTALADYDTLINVGGNSGDVLPVTKIPFEVGDTVTFRVNASQNYTVSSAFGDAAGVPDRTADGLQFTPAAKPAAGTYSVASKIIDLVITLA